MGVIPHEICKHCGRMVPITDHVCTVLSKLTGRSWTDEEIKKAWDDALKRAAPPASRKEGEK